MNNDKDTDKEETQYVEPHTCPFKEEMNGDTTTLCTCCPEKTRECAMDV